MSARVAAIYERHGTVFISAAHQTQAGFWIDDDEVVTLSEPTMEQLAAVVFEALNRSQTGVADPSPSDRFDRPLVRAAEVSSWKAFVHSAKHVRVRQMADQLKITPYVNLGSKEGFEPLANEAVTVPIGSDQLGIVIRDALTKH